MMTLSGHRSDPALRKHLRSYGMNTVAIDYIWQAILESERSDEFQFTDDELRIKAEADRLARLQRVRSGAAGREPIATTTTSLAFSALG
jgi:hypothetical protein